MPILDRYVSRPRRRSRSGHVDRGAPSVGPGGRSTRSRTDAVAGRRRCTVRIALLAVGALVIAICVAVMLWNDFGAGPLDVFIGALRSRTGLPLTFADVDHGRRADLVAWALGRRPGLGTVHRRRSWSARRCSWCSTILEQLRAAALAGRRGSPMHLLAVGRRRFRCRRRDGVTPRAGHRRAAGAGGIRSQRSPRAADAADVRGHVPRRRRSAGRRRSASARCWSRWASGRPSPAGAALVAHWGRRIAAPGQRRLLGAATLTSTPRCTVRRVKVHLVDGTYELFRQHFGRHEPPW